MFTFPKKIKQERISVSMPAELVQWVRETAEKNDTTISAVVAYALRQMKAEPMRQEIIRGLLEDAEDAEREREDHGHESI